MQRTRLHPTAANEQLDQSNISMIDSTINLDTSNVSLNRTVLDSTVAIEHKTKHNTEYYVRAIVSRKIVFRSRPKPIIANVAKQV